MYITEATEIWELANALTIAVAPSSSYGLEQNSPMATVLNGTADVVDLKSGAVTFAQEDLRLPGKGGLDLVIRRLYFSGQATTDRMAITVNEYDYEYEFEATTRAGTHLTDVWGIGVGWGLGFPSIETVKSGGDSQSYLHMGDGRVFALSSAMRLEGHVLKDMTFEPDTSFTSVVGTASAYALKLKEGTAYYFAQNRLIGVRNRYGDHIDFIYRECNGRQMVEGIRDTANRLVEFEYYPDSNRLRQIRYGDRTVDYSYEHIMASSAYQLSTVKDAEDRRQYYEYQQVNSTFGIEDEWSSSYSTNLWILLSNVILPSDGRISFEYGQLQRKPLGSDGYIEYPRVTNRHDSFTDAAGTQAINSSQFDYSTRRPYDGLIQGETYWTRVTDVNGTRTTTTFDHRNQMIREERLNTLEGKQYREQVEYAYHLEYELPTRKTTTKYNTAFEAGSPTVTSRGWDEYGNQVANRQQVGEESLIQAVQYEPKFQIPVKQYTSQDQGVYLVRENTVDSANGNITQTREYVVPISGSIESGIDVGVSLDRNRMVWNWVTPTIANTYIVVTTRGTGLPHEVKVRRVGDEVWLREVIDRHWHGERETQFELSSPGVYEVEVMITERPGCSELWVDSIKYDEPTLEGPIVTDYVYDPSAPVNLLSKTLTEKDGRLRTWQYEYEPVVVGQGPVEQHSKVYLSREFIDTHFEGENQRLETSYTYTRYGERATVTDGRQNQTAFSYDKLGRLVSESYVETVAGQPVDRVMQVTYDNVRNRSTVVTEINSSMDVPRETRYLYDPMGRPVAVQRRVRGGAWVTSQSFVYDAVGNRISDTDGNGRQTRYTYDAVGRLLNTTYADDRIAQIRYDDRQRLRVHEDTNGVVTDQYYDELGRLTRLVQRPTADSTVETTYEYDLAGNITKVTNDGQETRYSYGIHNKPTQITYPGTILASEEYTYWHDGQLHQRSDGASVRGVSLLYDEAGRLRKELYQSGASTRYEYDANSNLTSSVTYAAMGLEQTRVNQTYDSRNRVTEVRQWVESSSGQVLTEMGFTYGDGVNVTEITQPDAGRTVVHYRYDEWNRPWSVYSGNQSFFGSATNQGVRFDNVGNLTQLSYNLGTEVRTYDLRNRVASINSPHLGLAYTYDGEGNVMTIAVNNGESRLEQYGYDGLNRLTSAQQGANTLTYAYDGRGNRTHENGIAKWTYDGANVLTHIGTRTVSTDANGNMTTKPVGETGSLVMEYDDQNRLLRAVQDGVERLKNVYDAQGKRVLKVEDGRETIYMYLGYDTAYERERDLTDLWDDSETWYLSIAGRRVAKVSDGELQYFTTDHLGSVRVISDQTGAVVQRLDYQPYGEDLYETDETGPKFTGKPQDAIGLYYYGARFYDPELGRFVTMDPAKDGLNWWVYVTANPLRYVDPTGQHHRPLGEVQSGRHLVTYFANDVRIMALSNKRYLPGGGHDGLMDSIYSLVGWKGVDCTGLVIVSAQSVGLHVPGELTTRSIDDCPYFVASSTGDYQVGDIAIIDWDGDGVPNHAAIYVGGSYWAWASSTESRVLLVNADDPGEYVDLWEETSAAIGDPNRSTRYTWDYDHAYHDYYYGHY